MNIENDMPTAWFNYDIYMVKNPPETVATTAIVIIYDKDTWTDGDENFLGKMLGAVEYTLEEVILLAWDKNMPLHWQEIRTMCPDVQKCWGIGLQPEKLGLHWNIHHYTVYSDNAKEFLFSENLSIIQNDAQRKRQIWEAIKVFFTKKERN
jgi:hypothetical protein